MSRREPMTAMQRVLTALSHQEPDRVPFFLLNALHGARVLGLSIRDYFAAAETVVEGQVRMQARYGHDCLFGFFYAPVEIEAWGGEVVFVPDGPPNSGAPPIRKPDAIRALAPPRIDDHPCLTRVLAAIAGMKARVGETVPIIGVVVSPFSVPVMQMGFEAYLQLLAADRGLFDRLMAVNEAFCVAWADAQLRAGATAICYFDPVSSPTIVPRELYLETGHPVACRTLKQIKGPTATHFASGRCLSIVDDVALTGTGAVGVSAEEDLAALKDACRGRLTLIGNLNGIAMRHWDAAQAETAVREAIAAAGAGGGFVLSDNHGEIPWQVPETVLDAIAEAVRRWGRYPLAVSS